MCSFRDLLPILPELVLCESTFILCFWHLVLSPKDMTVKPGYIRYSFLTFLCVLGVLVATHTEGLFFFNTLIADSMGFLFKSLLVCVVASIFLLALFLKELRGLFSFEKLLLFHFSCLGGLFVFSSYDFITLFVALELHVLPLYLLIISKKRHALTLESSLKYFILGGFSSCLFLMGVSFIYGASGTTQFVILSQWLEGQALFWHVLPFEAPYLCLGLVFMFASLGFKLSLVPFHFWTPDVYEGAETGMTLFLSTAVKIVALGMTARLLCEVFGPIQGLMKPALTVMALLSMLWGSLGALRQTSIKRMLAYSTIAHMGYIASAFVVGGQLGVHVVFLYVSLYALTTVPLFACLLLREGYFPQSCVTLNDLRGFRQSSPALAMVLAALFLFLAGLPPFPLFFGKFSVVLVLVESRLWVLVVALALSSLIGCYYYLRVIKFMFFDEPKTMKKVGHG
ncbi:NADH-quinone oxidoreductase subunit N [Candidatus Hepatobacter penaei]|uniref:NADH-quinone oxidoreductase subunit N n=1 Tax=Candidatus Hepatobacter penaei TaxID=1274402 RepID=UPI0009E53BD6|nr:NADH-quinone oxidoreductase subunit N [Candidatus Hepatobacter penaei]TGW15796.1 NADH-quinone oxidoreductase subunit N [bacterium NHP-B]